MSVSPAGEEARLIERTWSELASDERIIEAANAVYNEVGSFPLPLSIVAERSEVSRSLIYAHFPDQFTLMNRLIEQHVGMVRPEIDLRLQQARSFSDACYAVSDLLFDHFVTHGRLLFRAAQDEFMRQAPSPDLSRLLRLALVKLTRMAVRDLDLKPNDALFIILIMSAIPEEAARLVSTNQVDCQTAQATLHRTLRLTLQTLER